MWKYHNFSDSLERFILYNFQHFPHIRFSLKSIFKMASKLNTNIIIIHECVWYIFHRFLSTALLHCSRQVSFIMCEAFSLSSLVFCLTTQFINLAEYSIFWKMLRMLRMLWMLSAVCDMLKLDRLSALHTFCAFHLPGSEIWLLNGFSVWCAELLYFPHSACFFAEMTSARRM